MTATLNLAAGAFNLEAEIERRLEAGDERADVVRWLIANMTPEQAQFVLWSYLLPTVVRVARSRLPVPDPRPALVVEAKPAPPPSRWDRMDPKKIAELRLRILNEPMNTPSGRKRLGDCTAPDLGYLADQRYRQAAVFDRLRQAMLRTGAEKVEDLGDQGVRLIADA